MVLSSPNANSPSEVLAMLGKKEEKVQSIGLTRLEERLDVKILWKADMRKLIPKSTGWVCFSLAAFRPTGKKEVCRESRSAQVFKKGGQLKDMLDKRRTV